MDYRRALPALLACLCLGQTTPSDAEVWNDFTSFLKTQPFNAAPSDVEKAYRARLTAQGEAPAEVDQKIAVVRRLAGTRSGDLIGIRFDKIYAMDKPLFDTHPSAFLADVVQKLKPGKALDVAMGQGRNTVFLAQQGWEVTGFDVSAGGLAAARADAARAGVAINAVLKSYQEFDFGKDQWDLVVLTYSLTPLDDPAFVRRIQDSVKPGGLVLVEQFNANPEVRGAKGPANALFKSFAGLRVLRYDDAEMMSEWGLKPARIGRILAQKE